MLAAIEFEDIERHDRIDGSNQDLASPQGQRFMRRLKIGIADRVEHDVGALAIGELADACCNIRARRVDHVDFGTGVALIGFVLAHHADRARALPARDLYRGLTDLAVDTHHQHGFVLVGHSGAAKAFHRGDERNANAGRLLPRQVLWFLDHRIGFNNKMRGVGAVAPDPKVARRAEYLTADHIGRTIDHGSCVVAAGRARKHRVGHQTGGGLDVGRIDGRRLELDQHLVRGPRQPVPLDCERERSRIVNPVRQPHAARLNGNRRIIWGS